MKLTNSWAVTYSLRYIVEAQRSKENMLMNKWLICGRNDFNNRRTARDMSAKSGGGSIVVPSIEVGQGRNYVGTLGARAPTVLLLTKRISVKKCEEM